MQKILIVDDDLDILEAVQLILETSGYKVDKTSQGNEVQNKIETFKPDLILLDVLLSGYDGRQIAKILKNNVKTKDIPIIVLSAHPSASKSLDPIGVDGFLAKPFDMDDLLGKISSLIGNSVN